MSKEETPQLVAGIDDKIPVGKSIVLGLQHVLSMDLYIMPLILGGAIGLARGDLSYFLQMSFFACGIAHSCKADCSCVIQSCKARPMCLSPHCV